MDNNGFGQDPRHDSGKDKFNLLAPQFTDIFLQWSSGPTAMDH